MSNTAYLPTLLLKVSFTALSTLASVSLSVTVFTVTVAPVGTFVPVTVAPALAASVAVASVFTLVAAVVDSSFFVVDSSFFVVVSFVASSFFVVASVVSSFFVSSVESSEGSSEIPGRKQRDRSLYPCAAHQDDGTKRKGKCQYLCVCSGKYGKF